MVAAAILRDGAVLAARRGPGMSLPGKWEFPGGKVEPGEDDAVALRREIREELGIEVDVIEQLAVASHDYPHLSIDLVLLSCRATGEPAATEHDALRWLTAEALTGLDWAPADVPLLPAAEALILGRSSRR